MTRVALIDGDMVAYRCAASAEEEPLDIALERADGLLDRIFSFVGAGMSEIWITGSNNFRYTINPQYKAQRKDKPKPRWLPDVQEHLIIGWNAKVTDGNEADDELGISQCRGNAETIIVTNDKDLLQVPGEHYNPVTDVKRTVSPIEGLHNFYYQLIMGDSSDNILGYDYKARQKVPKFLEHRIQYLLALTDERDMYDYVAEMYADATSWTDDWRSRMHMNAACLYIQRKPGDKWQEPKQNNPDLNPA